MNKKDKKLTVDEFYLIENLLAYKENNNKLVMCDKQSSKFAKGMARLENRIIPKLKRKILQEEVQA